MPSQNETNLTAGLPMAMWALITMLLVETKKHDAVGCGNAHTCTLMWQTPNSMLSKGNVPAMDVPETLIATKPPALVNIYWMHIIRIFI